MYGQLIREFFLRSQFLYRRAIWRQDEIRDPQQDKHKASRGVRG